MDKSNQKLEEFITKILQIQNQEKSPVLKVNDLKSIAIEMGLGEEGWQQISDTFNAHALRGKGFLDYKNWADAIVEFEQANTLNPFNTDVLYGLALSHQNLWNETQRKEYKVLAEKYAQNCIAIEPTYKEAIRLISELKRPKPIQNSYTTTNVSTSSQKKPINSKLIFILIFALVVLFVLFFVISKDQSQKLPESEYLTENSTETTNTNLTDQSNTELIEESPIKVYLVENEKSKGLNFELHKVKLNDYTTSYSLELKAYFVLHGIEVEELKVKVDIIDQNNKTIHSEIEEIVEDIDNTVRSGDKVPMEFTNYVKDGVTPKIKEVRLSVDFIVKETGDFTYAESKTIPVNWAIEKPSNFDIRLRERVNTKSEYFSTGMYHKLVLEVENNGNSTINLLQLQIKWFDKKNNVAQTEEFYLCIDSHPPIKRGEIRLYDRMFGLNKLKLQNFKDYTVTVLQVN